MIIGLIGKARSGKDTFAIMLAEELFELTKQRFVIMAYANELKTRVQRDFDLSYQQLWGNEKEIEDKRFKKIPKYRGGIRSDKDELPGSFWTPREILQNYGEFYRSINYDFWVDHLFERIDDKKYTNVIITDIRYINEATPVIDRKGILIKIIRDKDKTPVIHGQEHISEVAMDNYNDGVVFVENNGTLEEFKLAARKVAKKLINKGENHGKSKK